MKKMATYEELRESMIDAEDNGRSGRYSDQCDQYVLYYWLVDDRVITYTTEDEDFDAWMLTEDMMDELVIKE